MLKQDLIAEVANVTGLPKTQVANVLEALIESITKSLKKGGFVLLTGFGKFEVRERAAREGINPRTKEKIKLPASKVPAFKAGKALKEEVKG